MDRFTSEEIKKRYGPKIEGFIRSHNIIVEKSENGAFRVENMKKLKHLQTILSDHTNECSFLRKRKRLWNVKTNTGNIVHRIDPAPYGKNRNKSLNSFWDNFNMKIVLHSTSEKLPCYRLAKFPKNHILNTAKSGTEIFKHIMKINIKKQKHVSFMKVTNETPLCCDILRDFQKRHKKLYYYGFLKKICASKNDKHTDYVSIKQLRAFISGVITKVAPVRLFGKFKNMKKIIKAACCLLNTAILQPLDLSYYICDFDISSIDWLKCIEGEEDRWLIVCKLVKWFIQKYIIKVLRSVFHINKHQQNTYERIFIMRPTWAKQQQKYIKALKNSHILEPNTRKDKLAPPMGSYYLYSKGTGVRPLLKIKYTKQQKTETKILAKFLTQLYVTKYGSLSDANFSENWARIISNREHMQDKSVYLISCDVTDAYGSIIQEKLYNILRSLWKNVPEKLILRRYAYITSSNKARKSLYYTQYFANESLTLPIRAGALYTYDKLKSAQRISKRRLIVQIRAIIFQQKVTLSHKTYKIVKGLAQGPILSAILANIYYKHIMQEKFSIFIKSGYLFRYMDDILYVTNEKTVAKRFLYIIAKGVPEYNCKFSRQKTQSNIPFKSKTSDSIMYLGYQINCRTLEVSPEIRLSTMAYIRCVYLKDLKSPTQLLAERLFNRTPLKLTKLILSNKINTVETIIDILKRSSILAAQRAQVLILTFFDDVGKYMDQILTIIKRSNWKIVNTVINMYFLENQKFSETEISTFKIRIMKLFWHSYKRIFHRNNALRMLCSRNTSQLPTFSGYVNNRK